MGVPEDEGKRLVWHWEVTKEYASQDPAEKPYDWTEVPSSQTPGNPDEVDGELIVDYAIEFAPSQSGIQTTVGEFDLSKATVTLLDVDYELVKTADFCTIEDSIYDIEFVSPPMGLFEATVFQVFIRARDEA